MPIGNQVTQAMANVTSLQLQACMPARYYCATVSLSFSLSLAWADTDFLQFSGTRWKSQQKLQTEAKQLFKLALGVPSLIGQLSLRSL